MDIPDKDRRRLQWLKKKAWNASSSLGWPRYTVMETSPGCVEVWDTATHAVIPIGNVVWLDSSGLEDSNGFPWALVFARGLRRLAYVPVTMK